MTSSPFDYCRGCQGALDPALQAGPLSDWCDADCYRAWSERQARPLPFGAAAFGRIFLGIAWGWERLHRATRWLGLRE